MPRILAIRTPRYGYIDYLRGKSELYNMTRDPYKTRMASWRTHPAH